MFEILKELKNLLDPKSKEIITDQTKVSIEDLKKINGIQENEMTALFGTGLASTGESRENVGHAVNSIIMNLQKKKEKPDLKEKFWMKQPWQKQRQDATA